MKILVLRFLPKKGRHPKKDELQNRYEEGQKKKEEEED